MTQTTQTTDDLYGSQDSPEKGISNPIAQENAVSTEKEIANGNFSPEVMSNVVELPSTETGNNVLANIGDNQNGGTDCANNTEYAMNANSQGEVYAQTTSDCALPGEGKTISVESRQHHSHPSGTNNGFNWSQPPSRKDIQNAKNTNRSVWGMRSGLLYMYNKNGVNATIPFKSIYKDKK